MMEKIQFSPLGKRTFLISFLLGTFLLIMFWLTREDLFVLLGICHVLIAAVVNMLIALYELIEYLTDVPKKKSSGNSFLLLLVNIPVTLIYLFIVFNFC